MVPNPYDPRTRTDLSKREQLVLDVTGGVLHGNDFHLIDEHVAVGYRQHTVGIGQGRDGFRRYVEAIASKRPGRTTWRPIHLFEAGDFVILHKLIPAAIVADFFRFDDEDRLIEHWDVVQRLPEPDYDPMRLSQENFSRFYALFDMPPPS